MGIITLTINYLHMKKILFIIIATLALSSCKIDNKKSNEQNIVHGNTTDIEIEDGIKMLKEFYDTFYFSDEIVDNKNLKSKYISERILKRIDSLRSDNEELILDYDPFIKGQDYSGQSIKKTLNVIPLNIENTFRVSFYLFGIEDTKKIDVDFLLNKNENGNFLIFSILNDEYLNFKIGENLEPNKILELNKILTGTWRADSICKNPIGIEIAKNEELIICVEPNQYYIHLIKISNDNDVINYKLKNIEGSVGKDVYSEAYINNNVVAFLKRIDNNSIEFNWLGFYNKINDERQYSEPLISSTNPVILYKCSN